MEPTNSDILAQLADLRIKVDMLCDQFEQAKGAWWFIKLLASCAIGIAALYAAFHGAFTK